MPLTCSLNLFRAFRRFFLSSGGSLALGGDEGVFVKDGELGAVGGFTVTPALDQLPSDVVKGRPPVVSNVPNDGSPLKGRLLPNVRPEDDAMASLWVGFGEDFIRVAVQELPDQKLDHLAVFLAPTKPQKGTA
jgi:hypothetical protein